MTAFPHRRWYRPHTVGPASFVAALTAAEMAGAQFTDTMSVPSELVGLLIGTGGNTVRRLEEGCGVRLDIPRV